MPGFVRSPKDFLTGLLFIIVGLVFAWAAQDYGLGSARRMGPAYFPTILGGLLALLGLFIIVGSMFGERGKLDSFALVPLMIIVASTVVFGLLVRGAGLVPSVIALTIISFAASVKFRVHTALLLAIGLAAFSWVVFTWGLKLPMPAFGTWFGY